jgi:hypothetical protein
MSIDLENNISAPKAILITFGLALVGLFIFLFLGVLANAIIQGSISIDISASPNTSSPEGLLGIKILQMFQTIGIFLFPAIVISYMVSKKPFSFLGFSSASAKLFFLSVLLMVVFIPGINLIASLNAKIPMPSWMIDFEQQAEELIKAMLVTKDFSVFILNLFVVAVLPAIAEELFFRSVLQKLMIKWTRSIIVGIVLTAFLFSAIHMQFQGFIPRFLLGLVFGYLYIWSGSIWIPIAVHFANNATAVLIYYLMGLGSVTNSMDTVGNINDMWPLGLVSVLATSILAWIIWQNRKITPLIQPNCVQTAEDH